MRYMPSSLLRALSVLALVCPSAALAAPYPVTPNLLDGIANALANPTAAPAGADIVPCHSSVDSHPVVLVNGTFNDMQDDFGGMAPDLANSGYCVYTFNYGGPSSADVIQSIGPVPNSAQQLATFVKDVQIATGAATVDLVGHSQGGMLIEYYAKLLGGARNIHSAVAVAPTTHGTTLDGIANLASIFPGANQLLGTICTACTDQESTSAVIKALDAGPIAQTGVKYTVIETRNETVVTPVGSAFIQEPGVTNEYVQNFCPFDSVDHVDLPYDNVVIQLVKNALTPLQAKSPNCFAAFPFPTQ